jgi:biotin-(acetyl-CoA carboxylase) ligase
MKTETKKIIETIYKLEATDLDQIIQAVKMRRNQLHHVNANKLRIGDRVEFEGRGGRMLQGTVEKIKIKYVLVHADNGQRWNVPGSHLTQIGEVINA